MDILNNANTIISILVGLFGLGGYLVGITAYLRHKVTSSQQQILQRQPARRNVPQPAPNQLKWTDWMEVLWFGIEDGVRSRKGNGVFGACMVLLFGTLFPAMIIGTYAPKALVPYFVIFGTIYFTFIILFYVYFVGRRVEEKVEAINQRSARIQNP